MSFFKLFILLITTFVTYSYGECCRGRIDLAPAYVHLDSLQSGKTVRSFDLWAFRADATIMLYQGLCLKPSVMFCDGKASLNTASVGLGYCIPINDCLILTPSFGVSETRFKARIDFPLFGFFHLKERFVSHGGYLCLDATWTFRKHWRLCAIYQYTWSYVKTKINPLFKSRDHCSGPNYALILERDLNDNFSINLGAAYNISLSKEKHGLRGAGAKLGIVYWF